MEMILITPDETYTPEKAEELMKTLQPASITCALESLKKKEIISKKRYTSKRIPGRGYRFSEK